MATSVIADQDLLEKTARQKRQKIAYGLSGVSIPNAANHAAEECKLV